MGKSLDIAGACDRVDRRLQAEYAPEPIPATALIEAVVGQWTAGRPGVHRLTRQAEPVPKMVSAVALVQ